ncbi:MAG: SPOR domain-containing protein [Deltaproteobacteria bacterium]|jgi:hypothetical protein|nr:SPOR domain-containing protein [Deltaproteobacteria bacterium]
MVANDIGPNDGQPGWPNGIPQTPDPGGAKENVSRLVERLLSKETTFFDHYRLKNLGGSVESGPPLAKKPPAPPAGPAADAPAPEPGPAPAAKPKKESGWVTSVKWLTRLLFSFIVLAWVFVLGFIVGRVSLSGSDEPFPEKLQASAAASIFGGDAETEPAPAEPNPAEPNPPGPDLALADEVEPLPVPFPVVMVSPGPPAPGEPPTLPDPPGMGGPGPVDAPSRMDAILASAGPALSPGARPAPEPEAPDPPAAPVPRDDPDLYWPAQPTKPGRFAIQVGTAPTEGAARAMVEKFRAKGFADAYCYKAPNGKYNVRVGRYGTVDEGRKAAEALAAAGAHQPYVSKLNP